MEYLKGKLTAEELLRRIDTTHEMESYETARRFGRNGWRKTFPPIRRRAIQSSFSTLI